MNPRLELLQPYPFQKLRELLAGVLPTAELPPINLSIGEPKHPTPDFIRQTLAEGLGGLANYPTTQGSDSLRQAIAQGGVRVSRDDIDRWPWWQRLASRLAYVVMRAMVRLGGGDPDSSLRQ